MEWIISIVAALAAGTWAALLIMDGAWSRHGTARRRNRRNPYPNPYRTRTSDYPYPYPYRDTDYPYRTRTGESGSAAVVLLLLIAGGAVAALLLLAAPATATVVLLLAGGGALLAWSYRQHLPASGDTRSEAERAAWRRAAARDQARRIGRARRDQRVAIETLRTRTRQLELIRSGLERVDAAQAAVDAAAPDSSDLDAAIAALERAVRDQRSLLQLFSLDPDRASRAGLLRDAVRRVEAARSAVSPAAADSDAAMSAAIDAREAAVDAHTARSEHEWAVYLSDVRVLAGAVLEHVDAPGDETLAAVRGALDEHGGRGTALESAVRRYLGDRTDASLQAAWTEAMAAPRAVLLEYGAPVAFRRLHDRSAVHGGGGAAVVRPPRRCTAPGLADRYYRLQAAAGEAYRLAQRAGTDRAWADYDRAVERARVAYSAAARAAESESVDGIAVIEPSTSITCVGAAVVGAAGSESVDGIAVDDATRAWTEAESAVMAARRRAVAANLPTQWADYDDAVDAARGAYRAATAARRTADLEPARPVTRLHGAVHARVTACEQCGRPWSPRCCDQATELQRDLDAYVAREYGAAAVYESRSLAALALLLRTHPSRTRRAYQIADRARRCVAWADSAVRTATRRRRLHESERALKIRAAAIAALVRMDADAARWRGIAD